MIHQTLYLIRHTSVAIQQGICYGQSDLPCTEQFYDEAAIIRRILPHSLTFISSPLQRCTKLADYLSGGAFEIDDRLKELSFGDWELKAWSDIPRDESDPWCDDYVELAPPGGESVRVLIARAKDFIESLKMRTSLGPCAIISHRGCLGAILVSLLDLPSDAIFSFSCGIGSITQFLPSGCLLPLIDGTTRK